MNDELREKLSDVVDMEREEMVKELCSLINIPSVSNDRNEVMKALSFALSLGNRLGFRSEARAQGQVGLIETGSGDETLGILAHVDVVPTGPLEEWKTEPFSPVVKDGMIYGRGTLDDKGMVIASLYAMKAVESLGLPLKKKVQLILGSQEEIGWSDMYEYVASYELPDYGFTPDGEFPIQNIEKGICDVILEFDLNKEGEISTAGYVDKVNPINPSGEERTCEMILRPHVVSINAGSAANAVPGSAEALLSDGRIVKARGKAVHSSRPMNGVNAIFELNRKLKKMGVEQNIFTRILDTLEEKIGDCVGKSLSIYKDDEHYMGEYVHRNIFSPTIFKTEGDKISVLIDVRFAYGTDAEEIVRCFDEIACELGGSLRVDDTMPAVFVPRDRPHLKVMAEAYERHSGHKNEFTIGFGGSYAKAMPNIVSWGPIFPGDVDTCHEPNEFIPIENLVKCTKIYADAIAEILLSDESFR